ncbi:LysR family transcriptional regulator [Allosaccharopolyspora coralli]|uniref:LysR family transcriptional regulator n=1 Tax=Allosaccharopolyspora coralli TaxID=2665642 RepID=A0A5Q3QBM7_9PSEU|nr:LysR substrate-binding domain-containing protein [Allosaccharopolyspora coralli]QGK68875.1 LysR family transcriptional regulator [Allosaccharopolyspora coralli]
MTHHLDPLPDASQLSAYLAPTLALLRAVAEERHVTRAAQRLGMPQPSVSRALARLGTELGTPVVVREGRRIRLTRTGELLADAARDTLRTLDAGCRAVVEELDPERGQVVLGFQHTMGRRLVPDLIRSFRDEHPTVRFRLAQGARDDMLTRMHAGEIDLCLVSPLPEDEAFECAAVRDEPLFAVLHTRHRFAGRRRLHLAELGDDDFIATRVGYGLRQIFTDLTEGAGFVPRLAFEGEEVDTVRGLVAAGLGVALLPAADTGPTPGTVEIPLDPPAGRTVGLAWAPRHPAPPAVRAFRDFIRSR